MELDNTRSCPQAGSFRVTELLPLPRGPAPSSGRGPPLLGGLQELPPETSDRSGSWGLFPDRSSPGRVSPFLPSQVRVRREPPSPSTCALRASPCLSPPECDRGSGKAPMGSEGTGLAVVVFVLTFITCQTWFFLTRRPGPCGTRLHPRCGRVCLPGPRDGDASQNRLSVEPP